MERCYFLGGGGHETIRDFSNVPENAFTFSFVRNPWDRFVSAFVCQKRFISAGLDVFDNFVWETGEYPEDGVYRDHFLPQHYFLLDKDGKIGVDYIGHFETLQRDWAHVCAILGVREELPHYRKGNRLHYRNYYTPDTWEIVGRLYKGDVDLFGYGKEVFTPVNAMVG